MWRPDRCIGVLLHSEVDPLVLAQDAELLLQASKASNLSSRLFIALSARAFASSETEPLAFPTPPRPSVAQLPSFPNSRRPVAWRPRLPTGLPFSQHPLQGMRLLSH